MFEIISNTFNSVVAVVRRLRPTNPPVNIYPPEVEEGLFGEYTFVNGTPVWENYSYVGTPIKMYSEWKEEPQLLINGTWFDVNTKKHLAYGKVFTPAAEHAGLTVGYEETAANPGRSTTVVSTQTIPIRMVTTPPVFLKIVKKITGGYNPGDVLTKPQYEWHSAVDFTVKGQWYKNGKLTGITSDTYSDTKEGDKVGWYEECTNAAGTTKLSTDVYTQETGARYVSAVIEPGAEAIVNSVTRRIKNLKGGAQNMNVFIKKDHVNKIYERNPNLWAYDLKKQLTSCAVLKYTGPYDGTIGIYKSQYYESYGGILITPRHVLVCYHAHFWAKGTSPYNDREVRLRFINEENKPVHATWIHQSDKIVKGLQGDLNVGILDKPVDVEGIHIMPILTSNQWLDKSIYEKTNGKCPLIAMSQGQGRLTNQLIPEPASEYPKLHDIMLYIGEEDDRRNLYPGGPYDHFSYNAWDGDSGTPIFKLINNKLYLTMITTTNTFGGQSTGTSYNVVHENGSSFKWEPIDFINQLIASADANAIAKGWLDKPTNFKVKTVTWDEALKDTSNL